MTFEPLLAKTGNGRVEMVVFTESCVIVLAKVNTNYHNYT